MLDVMICDVPLIIETMLIAGAQSKRSRKSSLVESVGHSTPALAEPTAKTVAGLGWPLTLT